jgi:hypothetical protein
VAHGTTVFATAFRPPYRQVEEGPNRAEERQKGTIRHLSQELGQISPALRPFQALRVLLS